VMSPEARAVVDAAAKEVLAIADGLEAFGAESAAAAE
jgi:hypothetical protein